jgi:peptidyl-prolyl cis-trans isomerase SurA
MQLFRTIFFTLLLSQFTVSAIAQPDSFQLLDGIVAIVGDEIILHSEVEERVFQEMLEGRTIGTKERCVIIEDLLFEKLLVHNAKIDSLVVGDAEIMDEIERRLAYYVQMLGSTEAFEKEYGKSVSEWRADFTGPIKDQLLAQQMRGTINQNVRATPAQIIEYFEGIPTDSLALIPEEISYSEIVLHPEITELQKQDVRNTLDSIRTLVMSGSLSLTLAASRFSEDPGSKYKGGCYNNIGRGQFVPEFEAAAFDTPVGGYSGIFETDFGFHFLRVTDKRGEQFSACHVLMKAKVDVVALYDLGLMIDSLSVSLNSNTVSFEATVLTHSTRESSANQKGQVVNPRDGGVRFGVDELDPNIYFLLEPLDGGGISTPVQLLDKDGNGYWTILRLDARHPAHRANPTDDYSLFQNLVENNLRTESMNEWVNKNISETFIRLDATFEDCQFIMNWH